MALASALSASAFAQDAAPASEHTFTGNVGLVSSYRFRGIDQTFSRPALQGGFDYSHSSGFYAGNWNSNVNEGAGYPQGNLEMDFYGGYKTSFGAFGLDVGGLYYYYPGSEFSNATLNAKHPGKTANGVVKNGELYVAGSWKFVTLKYSYAVTDYFKLPETQGTGYLELSANYDLGDGWGINGHVGHLFMKDFRYINADGSSYNGSYTDWKIGATKDINGWVVGASYVGTDAEGKCSNTEFYCFSNSITNAGTWNGTKTRDAGRNIAVLSLSKTF
ncbi:MAG TPA: TorF family putative porin [Rhodocyclaceae bacterium]|nr:TorF family putative porin [Rhodocyclaceae bacterium]